MAGPGGFLLGSVSNTVFLDYYPLEKCRMDTTKRRLLIIGASARAAAELSRASDLHTCDLFADHDLQQVANADCIPQSEFPTGFVEWATSPKVAGTEGRNSARQCEWMYTGGIENSPNIVEEISSTHSLLGCDAATLRSVRDPFGFEKLIRESEIRGIRALSVARFDETLPLPHLIKPFASCGGLGIRQPGTGQLDDACTRRPSNFFRQEKVEGDLVAGLFLGNGEDCRLLGVTNSWVNEPGTTGSRQHPFRFGGSAGPIAIGSESLKRWQLLGQLFMRQHSLIGLFAFDCIITHKAEIAPLELNPRFTSSMELLPKIDGLTTVQWHLKTCRTGELPDESSIQSRSEPKAPLLRGKGILYAPETIKLDRHARERMLQVAADENAQLSDLPKNDQSIKSGQPLITVKTDGALLKDVRRRLSWKQDRLFCKVWQAAATATRLG